MKPFNLAEAKQGKPVQTRDGRKARIICFDAQDHNDEKYIVALVSNNIGVEGMYSYDLDGIWCKGGKNIADLVMAAEKKSGWINIYPYAETGDIYPSKESAVAEAGYNRIDTIYIEWEE